MKDRKKTKTGNQEKSKKTKTKTPRFALAARQKIVGYYQTGYFTAQVLCKKYGISVELLLKVAPAWLRESETVKAKEMEKYQGQIEKKRYKDKDEEKLLEIKRERIRKEDEKIK